MEDNLFHNYGRIGISFEKGEGVYLYDADGKEYLDLVAGIAVCSVGYSHPDWVAAVQKQAAKLVHVSNLYEIKEQQLAASKIASIAPKGMSKVLFVNSGAEANEAAMKLAIRNTGKKKILSALNSFHGRTAGSLGATGQTKYQDTFQPLIPDCFKYFDYNDEESLKNVMDSGVAAVMLEPVQGEGGVKVGCKEFFKTARDLCTDHGALLISDEVQTGFGRTGEWFGIDNFGVVPDIISMAKAMGGGVPVGGILTTEELSKTLTPGTHGTTFGGNPLVCAAVSATIDIMKKEKLVENSKNLGNKWKSDILSIKSDVIKDVRGMGLMIGIQMGEKASEFQSLCRNEGILVNVCHGDTVRLIPPLTIGKEHCDRFTTKLQKFLS